MRIYFDNEILKTVDAKLLKIYECSSREGTYAVIDTVKYNPNTSWVETHNNTADGIWYKISYVDSLGVESDLSDPVLGEDIENLVMTIRESLGDTNVDDPAFSDTEYIQKIRAAQKRHSGTESIAEIADSDKDIICKLTLQSCCYDLAYDNARYTKITLPDGISIDKGARVAHYLAIAKSIEDWYTGVKDDLSVKSDEIKVVQCTKVSYFKEKYRRF